MTHQSPALNTRNDNKLGGSRQPCAGSTADGAFAHGGSMTQVGASGPVRSAPFTLCVILYSARCGSRYYSLLFASHRDVSILTDVFKTTIHLIPLMLQVMLGPRAPTIITYAEVATSRGQDGARRTVVVEATRGATAAARRGAGGGRES